MTQHPETGLLAWGEHLAWDCRNDRATAVTPKDKLIHEPKRDFVYFDRLYEAEPERMLKYWRGLWDHQIADAKTGNFSRHAGLRQARPRARLRLSERRRLFHRPSWARAFEKSRDPVFTTAVQVLARRFLQRMNDRDLLDFDSSGAEEMEEHVYSVVVWPRCAWSAARPPAASTPRRPDC